MTTLDKLMKAGKRRLVLFAVLTLVARSVHAQDTDDLYQQIQALQNTMHIQITGLEKIHNEEKIRVSGTQEQQIQQLFADFNHVVSRNTKGQIERIVIINKKQQADEQRIVLPTNAEGNHRMVPVAVSGDGRLWQNLDMLIDTGADLVVLPDSMIDQIGLADSNFVRENIQTANGIVEAKIGNLKELRIAGETVENVAVAFIADAQLGQNSLLGMSVLGRYKLTIDDNNQTITLFKK